MTRPTAQAWKSIAEDLGTDLATVKAVFEVEASGLFYDSKGKLPRRFEPHHFPKKYWAIIGFRPGNKAPWRASLKIPTGTRRRMFDHAENLDQEAAFQASSWGAPQIMGFNHKLAGYGSATEMVHQMEVSADNQLVAFFNFVLNAGLDTHLRAQDWHAFAAGYNGNGQAAVYAGLIETAYRRQSGGQPSATTMRVGVRGDNVMELQTRLNMVNGNERLTTDGVFGFETLQAVKKFQGTHGLVVDGIAGAMTQRKLIDVLEALSVNEENVEEVINPIDTSPQTSKDMVLEKMADRGGALVGGGGLAAILAAVNENAQTILVGGVVAGGVALFAYYLFRKK